MSRSMTQWNVGMAGVIGLRYEALPVVMRAVGVPRSMWGEVLLDVQTMEMECLRLMRERRA